MNTWYVVYTNILSLSLLHLQREKPRTTIFFAMMILSLGSLGSRLGLSWGSLGDLLGISWGISWGSLVGSLLGLSWGSLGLSWGSLGLSWDLLGLSWVSPGALLGLSGGLLGRSWGQGRDDDDGDDGPCGPLGLVSSFGPSWLALLGPNLAHLASHFGPILASFLAYFLICFLGFVSDLLFGGSWALLGPGSRPGERKQGALCNPKVA